MHRLCTIHPGSLALGLVLGAVCFLAMSQSTVPTPARLEYLAHPRDMLVIRGGTPFTVPAGKLFVLTALGSNDGNAGANYTVGLLVNGQRESTCFAGTATVGQNLSDASTMRLVPPGFAVAGGTTIEVVEVDGSQTPLSPRAWGHLAPQ